MGSKIRILSLDGGGIRGIIPATIMVEIESRLQKNRGNLIVGFQIILI